MAGWSLNCASWQDGWGEHSCPRSATAIDSVAVDRTPNLPIERRTLFHWAIAAPNVKFKVVKIRTGCQYIGYFCYSRKPKLGRTKHLTGPHPGRGLELAGLEPMCAVKINMSGIFKQQNRPKTVAQSALLYLDIVLSVAVLLPSHK